MVLLVASTQCAGPDKTAAADADAVSRCDGGSPFLRSIAMICGPNELVFAGDIHDLGITASELQRPPELLARFYY